MALDPNSPAGQADSIYTELSAFYADMATKLQSGGEFPKAGELSLDHSELLRLAMDFRDRSANYAAGSAVETIHLAVAFAREYGMRVKAKDEYYLDSASEYTKEGDYYNNLKAMHISALQGNYSTGSTS